MTDDDIDISIEQLRVRIPASALDRIQKAAEEIGKAADKTRPHFERVGAVRELIDWLRGKR